MQTPQTMPNTIAGINIIVTTAAASLGDGCSIIQAIEQSSNQLNYVIISPISNKQLLQGARRRPAIARGLHSYRTSKGYMDRVRDRDSYSYGAIAIG